MNRRKVHKVCIDSFLYKHMPPSSLSECSVSNHLLFYAHETNLYSISPSHTYTHATTHSGESRKKRASGKKKSAWENLRSAHTKRDTFHFPRTLFFYEWLNIKPTFLLQLIACQHTGRKGQNWKKGGWRTVHDPRLRRKSKLALEKDGLSIS